jgi:capsular exopolysaccharide synthesis family protein
MGKIEEAIRKASLGREKIRKQRVIEHGEEEVFPDDTSATVNRLLPTRYRVQASHKHNPSTKALERHRIIHSGFSEEALTNYKMLRTRILQEYNANKWKTLAITAPHDGAGKSVTAVNLAITLASHGGHQIFLVDLDLRNPSIADYFDLPAELPGFTAYLDLNADLSSILWDVGVENLVVLANRDRIENSSERITSMRMLELIRDFEAASPKPIIIFDLPPVLTADDAVAMSPLVDGMLMVVSEGETPRDDLGHSLDLLRSANVLGVVLNKSGGR